MLNLIFNEATEAPRAPSPGDGLSEQQGGWSWGQFPRPVDKPALLGTFSVLPTEGAGGVFESRGPPSRFRKTGPSHSVALELFPKMPDQGSLRRALILLQNCNQISPEITALFSQSRTEGRSRIWSEALYCYLLIQLSSG